MTRSLLLALLLSACTVVGLYQTRLSVENLYAIPLDVSYAPCDTESWVAMGTIEAGKRRTVDVDPGCYSVRATFPAGTWTVDAEVEEGATFVMQWRPISQGPTP